MKISPLSTKLILGLCYKDYLTFNLESYSKYVDGAVLLYSSLLDLSFSKELEQYPYKFEDSVVDFSKMRNYMLQKIEEKYGLCNVIMPDDSFELFDFDRNQLSGEDSYLIEVRDHQHSYWCRKIFKSNLRFSGRVREQLNYGSEAKLLKGYFYDNYPNISRSINRIEVNHPFFLQNRCFLIGDEIGALKHIVDCLKSSNCTNEMKFISAMNKAIIYRKPHLILEAGKLCPERLKEAYYRYYQVTDDVDYLKKAYEVEKFEYSLPVEINLLSKIKDDYQRRFNQVGS